MAPSTHDLVIIGSGPAGQKAAFCAAKLGRRVAFLDPHTIRVTRNDESIDLRGEHVLVAVGTEPARPADVPFTPGRVIDSNDLLNLKDLPRSMIIVGGGVVGAEYACMLAAVGVT